MSNNVQSSRTERTSPPRGPITTGAGPTESKFAHVKGAISLAVPAGYLASLILRPERCDGPDCPDPNPRIYWCWVMVGRDNLGSMSLSFEAIDGDVRCDAPINGEISAAALEPQLGKFTGIANEGTPPVITGTGR
jgi:hypothetical protein